RESGTGLEELADVVASSSGLAESGLQSGRLRAGAPSTAPTKRRPMLLLVGAVVGLAVVLAIAWIVIRGRGPASQSPQQSGGGRVVTHQPNFCGTKLEGDVIVYVLDRGQGTRDVFSHLKQATYRSIESLGSDRRFQIVFWNNGTDEVYPPGGPAYATRDNVQLCRRALEEVSAFGQTDVAPALKRALAAKPTNIVLATGKGWDLEPTFAGAVLQIRGSSSVRIDAFPIGDAESPAMRNIASQTGGQYRTISEAVLRASAD
ncbi:MAG: hypothetical protein ACREJC_20990, partial [Tepidisphaeraceae bacterium]